MRADTAPRRQRSSVPFGTPVAAVIFGNLSKSGRSAISVFKLAAKIARGRTCAECLNPPPIVGIAPIPETGLRWRTMDEPIIDYLRARLKASTPRGWPEIAQEANSRLPDDKHVTLHSLRKIAYGDRENPGLVQVQALLDVFKAREQREAA